MRTRLIIAITIALALALGGCTLLDGLGTAPADRLPGAPVVSRGVVTKHTDGDTMHVRIDGDDETVRFIGIDAPEVGSSPEPFGEEASRFTAEIVPLGTEVWIETDAELRDRYGRLLAYVWLDEPESGDEAEARESMLNALIVLNGYAYAGTYPPNVSYQGILRDCQAEANAEGRGLWAEHEPERQ